MLCIEQSKSAQAARDYFTQHLARGDYYIEGESGQHPGIWVGQGAERLGLAGRDVTAEDFGAIADNKMPGTGERLTVRDAANRRPGYDFMFAPPKSFSALWARTEDERLLEIMQEAVVETLRDDIEPEVKTRVRRNGKEEDITVGNLIASLHLHTTTRPLKEDGKPDPQIHIHAYVHNVCWAEHEQRWQAVQFGTIKADGRYFEAAFEARLAAKARQLGFEVARDGKGRWEISGVPESVLTKFSRRRFEEILPEAERRGITDGEGRSRLGRLTRQGKGEGEELPAEALHAYWNGRLSGDEAAALDAAYAQAQAGGGDGRAGMTARQAVEHALEHFFGPDGRNSCEGEKDILEEALRYGAGQVLPAAAKKELDGRKELIRADIGGGVVCTTAEVLAEEQSMSRSAWSGRNCCARLDGGKPYVAQGKLDQEQHAAVGQILASRDRVLMLLGKSGAGKTTTLRELEAALLKRQRRITAFAPTTKARDTLREKGFDTAQTLQALLASPELQTQARGHVVLIDEAGMAGTRALRQVFDLVDRQQQEGFDTRVLLVGDPKQHRGVPRGQVLTILQEQAGLTPARLTTIRRQKDPEYRKAVELLSEGKAGEAFDLLDKIGFIQEIADPEERYRALAKDYADRLAAGDSQMIVAPTHAEGRETIAAVREELRARGQIGPEDRSVVRYDSKNLTIAQRKDAAQYQEGDTIQWNQHAPGFKRGERLTVAGVSRQDGRVLVEDGSGQARELPLPLAERFEVYRTADIGVAEGDRLRITRNGVTARDNHRLNNGDIVTVAGFTGAGDLIDRRGWVIARSYGHLAHGVVTSHGSQSAEDEVPFLAQSATSRGASSAEQFYVSVSRGKQGLRVYTDDKEALRAAVARSEQARSATDVWQASERQRQAERQAAGLAAWQQRLGRTKKARRVLEAGRAAAARTAAKVRERAQSMHKQQESRGLGVRPRISRHSPFGLSKISFGPSDSSF
jgi:conjugative relaxase-like TrwC/TraI family protein